jgi:hypothetical protein
MGPPPPHIKYHPDEEDQGIRYKYLLPVYRSISQSGDRDIDPAPDSQIWEISGSVERKADLPGAGSRGSGKGTTRTLLSSLAG